MDMQFIGYELVPRSGGWWERLSPYGPISLLEVVRQALGNEAKFFDLDVAEDRDRLQQRGLPIPDRFVDRMPGRLLCFLRSSKAGLPVAFYHAFDPVPQKLGVPGVLELAEIDRKENPMDGSIRASYEIHVASGCSLWIDDGESSTRCASVHFAVQIKR